VTPKAPAWIDTCGPDNGFWQYADTDEYAYSEVTNDDGSITVTATAAEGYAFPEDAVTEWTEVDSGEVCPPTPAGEEDPGAPQARFLPATGGSTDALLPLGGGTVLVLGLALVALAAYRRSRA
jgi:LPXTG-motif cell wall-anchored protein